MDLPYQGEHDATHWAKARLPKLTTFKRNYTHAQEGYLVVPARVIRAMEELDNDDTCSAGISQRLASLY